MTALRAIVWCAVSTIEQTREDKYSLLKQENDGRLQAEQEKWELVAVLKVPGFSRAYIDIHECAEDMQAEGISAFRELLTLWKTRAFDVLVCRDGDRFARTQTLFAYVVETTISLGARIYSLSDGWVDEKNYRLWIAMGGYKAAGDIDRLKAARHYGMNKNAARGLPTSSLAIMSHKVIRDSQTGKALKLVVDEDKRYWWDGLAVLLLEGVGFGIIDSEMYSRYGVVSPRTGRRFASHTFYAVLHSPTFWGHSARHYHNRKTLMRWPYDLTELPPQGVLFWPNTHEAVYTGSQAELVTAELNRRHLFKTGSGSTERPYKFTGLLVCNSCGHTLCAHNTRYQSKTDGERSTLRWQCNVGSNQQRYHAICPKAQHILDIEAVAGIDMLLRRALASKQPENFFSVPGDDSNTPSHLASLGAELAELKQTIRQLIRSQAGPNLTTAMQSLYLEEITSAQERLTILEASLVAQQQGTQAGRAVAARVQALLELRAGGLDTFWLAEPRLINQRLHRIMGPLRFAVADHDIVNIVAKR